MTLQTYKAKIVGAKKGYDLLKKKADALKKAFRAILQKIVEAKVKMGADYKEALLGLAGATFAAGDFSRAVIDHVKTKTSVRLNVQTDNIAGVHLPLFNLKGEDEQSEDNALLGLSGGGQAITQAREKFTEFLKILVTIASLQTQFITLDEALKMTNRRVNALEFVVIPKFADIIQFIIQELDEIDREDFVRIKKTQDKKKSHKAKADAAMAKHDEKTNVQGEETVIPTHKAFGDDEEEDEDIFV